MPEQISPTPKRIMLIIGMVLGGVIDSALFVLIFWYINAMVLQPLPALQLKKSDHQKNADTPQASVLAPLAPEMINQPANNSAIASAPTALAQAPLSPSPLLSASSSPTYARPVPQLSGGGASGVTPTPTPAPSLAPTLSTIAGDTALAADSSGSATAHCPPGTTLVGGGFSAPHGTKIRESYKTDEGWYVKAQNPADDAINLKSVAQCVSNIPGSVTTSSATTTVSFASVGQVTKNCPAGQTAISGGFEADNLHVIFSNKVGNGWRVRAQNLTLSSKPLTVSVNCYSASVSLSQVQENRDVPASWALSEDVACTNGMLIMGGYSFGRHVSNSFYEAADSHWRVGAVNPTASTMQLQVYGYCASF